LYLLSDRKALQQDKSGTLSVVLVVDWENYYYLDWGMDLKIEQYYAAPMEMEPSHKSLQSQWHKQFSKSKNVFS